MSVHQSVYPHVSAQISLVRYLWNLVLGTSWKSFKKIQIWLNSGQKHQAFYSKTQVQFVVAGNLKLPYSYSVGMTWYVAVRIWTLLACTITLYHIVCLIYLFTEKVKNLSIAQCVKMCNAIQIQHCILTHLPLHTPVYLGYAICVTHWYGNRPGRGKVMTSWYDVCWLACRECMCMLGVKFYWDLKPWHWVSVTWYFEGALGKAKPMTVSYPLKSYLSMTPLWRCQILSVCQLHRNT